MKVTRFIGAIALLVCMAGPAGAMGGESGSLLAEGGAAQAGALSGGPCDTEWHTAAVDCGHTPER